MIEDSVALSRIWGTGELAYSRVVAQTLALSKSFRLFVFEHLQQRVTRAEIDWSEVTQVIRSVPATVTEKGLGESGRIDILLDFGDEFTLGIENKAFGGLQQHQLKRYAKWLSSNRRRSLLLFLAPSSFALPTTERPDCNFAAVDYRAFQQWIKDHLKTVQIGFEHSYFTALWDYCGELEMKPLTNNELNALAAYSSALSGERKLQTILGSLDGVATETRHGQYILTRLEKEGLPIYAGFRIGNDWYYREPLLNNRPEAVVYVKDEEDDPARAKILANRLQGLDGRKEWKPLAAEINFYPRKSGNECRFAIRRNLETLETREADEIVDWFKTAIDCMVDLSRVR